MFQIEKWNAMRIGTFGIIISAVNFVSADAITTEIQVKIIKKLNELSVDQVFE